MPEWALFEPVQALRQLELMQLALDLAAVPMS